MARKFRSRRIKLSDDGELDRISETFSEAEFNNGIIAVGVVDRSLTYDDKAKTPVASVAFWNEYGTKNSEGEIHAPARPAIRTAVINNEKKYVRMGEKEVVKMLKGKARFTGAVGRLGREMVKDIKHSINAWEEPPNAASTVAAKGFNDPLIDTRRYYDSIAFKKLKTRLDQV